MTDAQTSLSAVARVCSLKPSPAASSSELIAEQVFAHLRERDVSCQAVRCADVTIAPGVETYMGEGDEWPTIRMPATAAAARNAVHLAQVLRSAEYPAYQ